MAIEVTMPQLGESVTEGTVGAWLKQVGDRIERDEPLVEVITDKVNAEVPSPVEGTITEIVVPAGETVPVGQVIARIEQTSRASDNGIGAARPMATQAVAEAVRQEGQGPMRMPRPAPGDGDMRRRYSPVVRRLAKEHRIDLTALRGTGIGGRVTKKDVLAYIARTDGKALTEEQDGVVRAADVPGPGAPAAAAATAAGEANAAADAPIAWDVIEPDPIRRTIAQRMVQSWREVPHAWAMVEADVTGLVKLREKVKDEFARREGVPLTFVPFWIKAVVQSLRDEPRLNATWQDGKIVVHHRINVALAVGVEGGLVVPVITDADKYSTAALARKVHELAEKARSGRLAVDEVQGGTITLNNTGALGVVLSKSIVNPPHTAICNFDAIVKRPIVIDDAIAIRSMVNLTISFDHRVVDGVQVGRFLQGLKARMEAYGEDTSLY